MRTGGRGWISSFPTCCTTTTSGARSMGGTKSRCGSVIRYAGDGLWASEEDFWDLPGARSTSAAYAEACRRAHADTPEQRMTRRFWPEGPSWARTDAPPNPSWVGFPDVPGITKPRELAELLGRDLV